ncbi:MAG: hypothetical protein ACRERD_21245 [Candidatus Binatia bacterium]
MLIPLLVLGVGFVPMMVRDKVYNGIARIRHSLFRTPVQACPLAPTHLRKRFDTEDHGALWKEGARG